MKKFHLVCTNCKKEFPPERVNPRCDVCHEPLEAGMVKTGAIKKGNTLEQTILERYADFFPFLETDQLSSLHEGFTPLVTAKNLATELGVRNVFLKNETQNPTWSFKDRGTAVSIAHAISLGYSRIGTVSTGNMAASVAAYGASMGLETFIIVSPSMPPEKISPIAIFDPVIIKIEDSYASLYDMSLEIGPQRNIYFSNSDIPFRVEGSKTIAFEICEQLDFNVPDYVIVPTSSGGNLRGILKGFEEFKRCGLISRIPKMVCAQASGCSPIYNAFLNKQTVVTRTENPNTIALAIANPAPPSGNEVLRKLRELGGLFIAVSDDEILQAQRQLSRTGIFGQPASAVPLAAVKKLRETDSIEEGATVVCIITGAGLKDTKVLARHNFRTISSHF